jgi:hypothetical protein
MSKKPTIRLKIKIGEVEHEMSTEEVKALRDALLEIYPVLPLHTHTVRHEYVPRPWRDYWHGPAYAGGSISSPPFIGAVAQNAPALGALDAVCLELKAASQN